VSEKPRCTGGKQAIDVMRLTTRSRGNEEEFSNNGAGARAAYKNQNQLEGSVKRLTDTKANDSNTTTESGNYPLFVSVTRVAVRFGALPASKGARPLMHQVSDWCSGAAANFGWMREAKREIPAMVFDR
jgi:hypothetical protein